MSSATTANRSGRCRETDPQRSAWSRSASARSLGAGAPVRWARLAELALPSTTLPRARHHRRRRPALRQRYRPADHGRLHHHSGQYDKHTCRMCAMATAGAAQHPGAQARGVRRRSAACQRACICSCCYLTAPNLEARRACGRTPRIAVSGPVRAAPSGVGGPDVPTADGLRRAPGRPPTTRSPQRWCGRVVQRSSRRPSDGGLDHGGFRRGCGPAWRDQPADR